MVAAPSFIFGEGQKYKTPEELERARQTVMQIYNGIGKAQGPGGWFDSLAKGIAARSMNNKIDRDQNEFNANRATADSNFFTGAPAFPASVAAGGSSTAPAATGVSSGAQVAPEIKDGIVQTAASLGIDPVDLGTAISYETAGTFDPTKAGPRTQWGQHKGLIQFGEPQAKKFGVDWNNPVGSQLGENGAVANYLRNAGVKPGMKMLDIYSAINAGGVGKYNASDANNGGAPGTVRDKVEKQMAGHRAKAMALLGFDGPKPVQVASLDPSAGMAEAMQPTREQVVQQQRQLAARNGFVDGQPVAQPQQQPMGLAAANPNNYPEAGNIAPVDWTDQPNLSAGAGMSFQGGQQPQGQETAALQPQQPQMAPQQAPALRPQADPNDTLVAGADQTMQPSAQELGGNGGFPPAPSMGQQQSPQAQLEYYARAMSNPFISPEIKRVAATQYQQIMQQQQQASDPAVQLDMQYKQAQIDALSNKQNGAGDFKVVGDQLVRISPKGEISDVTPQQTGAATTGEFRFGGKSVEAQALNGLMDAGTLTPAQAQQLGAGKTITDPSTGAIMFMTPQGIFSQPATGGAPTALSSGSNAAPQGAVTPAGGQPGMIPLTAGKEKPLTEGERKNRSLYSVIKPELVTVETNFDALADPKNQVLSRLPFSEYATTPEYQKAANSLQTIISSYLYSVSGATATPDEVRKQTDILLPRPGEAAESIANKKLRIRNMVEAVAKTGGMEPEIQQDTGGGWQDLGGGVRVRVK
ncbi:hypothetical protein [Phyllobacterium sp. SB3]|uniref:hypothetical protein n=1 Tax=Phyllobacterium sp. SB3 TaxID=3156073 RepID=UPI0032B0078A